MTQTLHEQRMLAPEATDQWLWIVLVASLGAFCAALGIGANDVANSFATPVASKALTLKKALLLAGICEFFGALLLGRQAITAISESIADVSCFLDNPGVLMYGMMCVLYTTAMWLLLASYLELPVSATQSTISSIVGMTLAYEGRACVVWHRESEHFPGFQGVGAILLYWLLSPIVAGVASCLVFLALRTFVLRSSHAFRRSFWVFPVLVVIIVALDVFFLAYRGRTILGLGSSSIPTSLLLALGLGGGIGLLIIPTALPAIRNAVLRIYHPDGTRKTVHPDEMKAEDLEIRGGSRHSFASIGGTRYPEIHAPVVASNAIVQMHANVEKFDPRVEEVFKGVQVVSAMCGAFAHGAFSVANVTGPIDVIYIVYLHGGVPVKGTPTNDTMECIILFVAAVGMVVGLWTYGHKVMTTIGARIAKITPSRGFSIELGAVLVMITCTRTKVPLSSTQCQVGATVGVALLEGKGGLNFPMLFKIVVGWGATVVMCGLTCSLLFVQGVYAPFAYDTVN